MVHRWWGCTSAGRPGEGFLLFAGMGELSHVRGLQKKSARRSGGTDGAFRVRASLWLVVDEAQRMLDSWFDSLGCGPSHTRDFFKIEGDGE
jgi:hypothetical protein